MIFIPTENIRTKWNFDNNSAEYIIWTYNNLIEIHYIHNLKDNYNSYVKEIETTEKDGSSGARFEILCCSELACQAKPQLRYNKILNKYFCCCPSSMICTKNDDKDEVQHFKEECHITEFTEEYGFFDDPLKAIINWQKARIEDYIFEIEEVERKIENE